MVCRGIIAVGKIWRDQLADIVNPCIGKGFDPIAAGGDPPVAFLRAMQQQYPAVIVSLAISMVIKIIICIIHGALALQTVHGDNDNIHALPFADLI